jgi:hypothetical protein
MNVQGRFIIEPATFIDLEAGCVAVLHASMRRARERVLPMRGLCARASEQEARSQERDGFANEAGARANER